MRIRVLAAGAATVSVLGGCGHGSAGPAPSVRAVPVARPAPIRSRTWSAAEAVARCREPYANEPIPPQVAVGGDGTAAVACESSDGRRAAAAPDVMVRIAPPGQRFGPARVAMRSAIQPQLVVQRDGTLFVGATSGNVTRGRFGAQVVVLRPDGGRRVVSFGRSTYLDDLLPLAHGRTLVLVGREQGGEHRTRLGVLSPSGRFQSESAPSGIEAGGLRAGPDGTVAAPIVRGDGAASRVSVAIRSPAGTWRVVPTALSGPVGDPALAVAPDGTVGVVAVRIVSAREAQIYGDLLTAEVRPGRRRSEPPGSIAVRPVASDRRHRHLAFDPVIAYDAAGRRVVVWKEGAGAEVSAGRAIAWARGRRFLVSRRAREVHATGVRRGVLVAADAPSWRTEIIDRRLIGVRGPRGAVQAPFVDRDDATRRVLAAGAGRAALAWRDRHDRNVVRVALLGRGP